MKLFPLVAAMVSNGAQTWSRSDEQGGGSGAARVAGRIA
jgi:hypothetical protein